MKNSRLITLLAAASAIIMTAGAAFAQQASLTLRNCDTKLCNKNNTAWTLTKELTGNTVANGVGTLTWTVTATKGAVSDNIIEVHGYLTIYNGGSAGATIGNIVVNLQKRAVFGQPTWVSAAADMADATVGAAATKANICSPATQEDPAANASVGAGNYTEPGGGKGVFVKTAGSGTVQFTDANNNTAYSLVPQVTIPPGGEVSLLWHATFNNTVLGLAAGAQVRTETIVTFGNAGGRGDSGASCPNIDINGSGVGDTDEAHVRSVPCRISLELPALIECNKTVTLADTDPDSITTPGETNTITWDNFTTTIGGGTGIEAISATTTRTVSVDVDGGDTGGTICNLAGLKGDDCNLPPCSVTVGTNTFKCCVPAAVPAQSCVEVGPTPPEGGYDPGDFCGYTQGGWGADPNGGNVGALLYSNFNTVYPGGVVEIGISGAGGYSIKFLTKATVVNGTAQNLNQIPAGAYDIVDTGDANPKYTYKLGVTVTAAEAITAFLPQGDTPNKLTADLENPTSSSAGVLAGQVLALKLNVDFSAAGITPNSNPTAFGNLVLCNAGASLQGSTVAQILAAANTALGGGSLPAGYTYSTLNDLISSLNEAFDNCKPTDWANTYLCLP